MIIGLANGCMDLFHNGHLHYLTESAFQCDYLIFAVNSDASVKRLKGPERPIQDLAHRMQAIRRTGLAHAIIPFEGDVGRLLMCLRPDVLFKGYDHGKEAVQAIRRPGWKDGAGMDIVKVVHISHLPGHSTTLQVNARKGTTAP